MCEYVLDDPTPDDYFHLKGGAQKREDACMDADHNDEECPTHGHASACPSMCPVYDLDADDDRRQRYRALARERAIERLISSWAMPCRATTKTAPVRG